MMQLTIVERMRRTSFADMNCSVAQSLEVIGEWWTPLILRDAFMGVRRFEQFQTRLGIARNVLASRLESLVEHGILEEVQYQDRPVRFEYVLTSKGSELWTVLTMLRQWGDKWLAPAGARRGGAPDVWSRITRDAALFGLRRDPSPAPT